MNPVIKFQTHYSFSTNCSIYDVFQSQETEMLVNDSLKIHISKQLFHLMEGFLNLQPHMELNFSH